MVFYAENFCLDGAVDPDLSLGGDVNVKLQPDTVLAGIKPRLHREHGARQQLAVVVGLVIVQVGPHAVARMADAVAGAVHDELRKAVLFKDRPGLPVDRKSVV